MAVDQSLIPSVTSVATSQRPFGVHSLGSLAQSDARLIPTPLNSKAIKTQNLISNLVMPLVKHEERIVVYSSVCTNFYA